MDVGSLSSGRMYDVLGGFVVVATLAWIGFGLVSSHEELPECEQEWSVGETLPEDYEGCHYPSGVESTGMTCADGSVLFDFEHELYAAAGETIAAGYDDAYQRCLTDS